MSLWVADPSLLWGPCDPLAPQVPPGQTNEMAARSCRGYGKRPLCPRAVVGSCASQLGFHPRNQESGHRQDPTGTLGPSEGCWAASTGGARYPGERVWLRCGGSPTVNSQLYIIPRHLCHPHLSEHGPPLSQASATYLPSHKPSWKQSEPPPAEGTGTLNPELPVGAAVLISSAQLIRSHIASRFLIM